MAIRVRLVPCRQFLFQPGAPAARNPKDLRYFPFRYLPAKSNILPAIYKKKELRPNDTARIPRQVISNLLIDLADQHFFLHFKHELLHVCLQRDLKLLRLFNLGKRQRAQLLLDAPAII